MARTKATVKKAQPGPDKTVADSGTVHDTVEANDSRPLNHAQKAAKTRKRNQVAQMVAEATAKTPGPRLAKTVALKNAIWMEAQQPVTADVYTTCNKAQQRITSSRMLTATRGLVTMARHTSLKSQ
ncbi:hypothetical protein JOM56_015421 [Amanita muscaria]